MSIKNVREFNLGTQVAAATCGVGGLLPGFHKVEVTSKSDFASGLTVYCGNTATHHVVMRSEAGMLIVAGAWLLTSDYEDVAIAHILSMAEAHFALTTPNHIRLAKREIRAGSSF